MKKKSDTVTEIKKIIRKNFAITNTRIQRCVICEGTGMVKGKPCQHCQGIGYVYVPRERKISILEEVQVKFPSKPRKTYSLKKQ